MKNLRKILMALLICVMIVSVFVACNDTPKKPPEETDPHTHVFGNRWQMDGDNHWIECSCGERMSVGAHELDEGELTSDKVIYTCRVCKGCFEENYDPTETADFYWGLSAYGSAGDVIAKYEFDRMGKPIRTTHYNLVGLSANVPYGIFFESIRETYEYGERGRLEAIETVIDASAVGTGAFGILGPTSMTSARLVFEYDDDGRMVKGDIAYQGEHLPRETVLIEYGSHGKINRVKMVAYDDHDTVYYTLEIKDGKIIKRDTGSAVEDIGYDKDGHVSVVRNQDSSLAFSYVSDALVKIYNPQNSSFGYIYNYSTDGTLKECLIKGVGLNVRSEFGYDSEKRMTSFVVYNTLNGKEIEAVSVKYGYNRDGKLVSLVQSSTASDGSLQDQNMTLEYDGKGRLSQMEIIGTDPSDGKVNVRVTATIEYDGGDRANRYIMSQYVYSDGKGTLVKSSDIIFSARYGSKGETEFICNEVVQYDAEGNITEGQKAEITTDSDENGKTVTEIGWEYDVESKNYVEIYKCISDYDKDGNALRVEERENGERTVYEYQLNAHGECYCKTVTYYYKDGGGFREAYNEHGDITEYVEWDERDHIIKNTENEYSYDDKGLILTVKKYENRVLDSICEYGRNKNGEVYISKETYYYFDGTCREKIEYNEIGFETLHIIYDEKGVLTESTTTVYTYNDWGDIKSGKKYDKDGFLFRAETYDYSEYYKKIYVLEGTNYNKDGSTEVLIYDQEGYICTRYLYSSDGVLTYNGTYEYMLDENGELIGYKEEVENRGTLIIRYAFKKNGEKYIKYREEIVLGEGTVMESYDDDGRIIRKSEYAADNSPYRFTTYTYNSDGSYIVETTTHLINEVRKETVRYDKDGNVIF